MYVGVGITKLGHMLYGCDMVRDFRDEIISFINELYCISPTNSPALGMLGIIPSKSKMCDLRKSWCRLAMLTAYRIIVRQWKKTSPSSFKNWIELTTNIVSYERAISRLSGHQAETQEQGLKWRVVTYRGECVSPNAFQCYERMTAAHAICY